MEAVLTSTLVRVSPHKRQSTPPGNSFNAIFEATLNSPRSMDSSLTNHTNLPAGLSRAGSPALSTTSSLTSLSTSATPPPTALNVDGSTDQPPAKRRKLTSAEKQVKAFEKAEKEKEKIEAKAKRDEEKAVKDEERRIKNEAKEEKKREKELKTQEKEEEKQKKQAELDKKAKVREPWTASVASRLTLLATTTPVFILQEARNTGDPIGPEHSYCSQVQSHTREGLQEGVSTILHTLKHYLRTFKQIHLGRGRKGVS